MHARTVKSIVCTIAFFVAATSHASKARLSALQFADFWRDTQTIFQYPQYANDLGQYATFEYGPTGTFSTGAHAEGGFAKKTSDGIWGLYLGHQNTVLNTLYTGASLPEQQNPLFLYYSTGNMGVGLNVSYSDTKTTGNKEMSFGGSFGSKLGDVDVGLTATAYAKSENATSNAKIIPVVELAANRSDGDLKWYGAANLGRTDIAGATATSYSAKVGVQDHGIKLDGGAFYYGAQVGYAKNGTTKGLNLPLYVGLESDIFSWATVRGAVSQSLINYQETTAKDINTNNTVVSLGASAKTGKFQLDGLLAAGTTGLVNGTSFLTSAALIYKF